ncbi:alpha/beta hydrolase-fold protein [Lysobacter sp. D1-1-M9]|uniref:alpha/beta hydrolase-fold protein n=1 Tax=Novilysobacter longmucuonensis TaxID=3098603 RepID=UPI002FC6F78E
MTCRRLMLFLLLCLLLVFCVNGFAGTGVPIVIGESRQLHSVVLDEDRTYQVFLPDSYAWAQGRHYPVLYVLDGKSHYAHTAASVDYLAAQGEIPEMIVVAVASTNRVRDFTQTDWASHWVGGGGADNFMRFLSSELIPEVERSYRTDGFRILSGHSAGGQFALHGLTSEPTLFKAYFALSPSLNWDDRLPQRSLQQALRATGSLSAFLYVARSDDAGQALADYEALVATLRDDSPHGFRWHAQAFPEETHGGMPLLAQIDALRSLYAGYHVHNDQLGEGLAAIEQRYRKVSEAMNWPMAVPEDVINRLGYVALGEGRTGDAIALFRRNVDASPESANAWDSLADGYAASEQWSDAAHAAEQSLALATRYELPNHEYFAGQLKKMQGYLQQPPAD